MLRVVRTAASVRNDIRLATVEPHDGGLVGGRPGIEV